jgi:two-component system, sensor histidine kinase and response regulator
LARLRVPLRSMPVLWWIVRLRRGPILVADDDEATREGLREFLSQAGYRVVAVRDGQEAMNLLVDGLQPSLLILDVSMPSLRGDELLKYVQSDSELRFVPVLIVTGAPEQCARTVADHILSKPLNLITLLAHIRRLIETSGDRRRKTRS